MIPFAPMPIDDFRRERGEEPWTVLLDDRGPQIVEFPNAYALSEAACEQMQRRLANRFDGRD